MAPQVYTDNNRHANIGHQHTVYDQHIVYDKQVRTSQNKSEQETSQNKSVQMALITLSRRICNPLPKCVNKY